MDRAVITLVILYATLYSVTCIRFHIVLSPQTSQCPGELAGEPCLTLEQYVSYPSQSDYVTLQFEPGNHTLKSQLSISSRSYFGLVALGGATVDCNGQSTASVTFSGVNQVDIRGITFIRCGRVRLISATTGSIERSKFLQTVGNNALYISSSQVTIGSCTFANNSRRSIRLSSTIATIMSSTFSDNMLIFDRGGAIYSSSKSLTIIQSNFKNNTAWYDGGAVYFDAYSYTLTVQRCIFEHNTVYSGEGGAVSVSGNYGSATEPSSGNIYKHNRATTNGGALYVTRNIYMNDSIFTNNSANTGGAIYAVGGLNSMVGVSLVNNTADSNGGAVYTSFSHQSVALNEIRFINNTAGGNGGGMYTGGNYNTIRINKSHFLNNRASSNGGAIHAANGYGTVITNDTMFINNRARARAGGAIYVQGYQPSITTYDTTFTNNVGYTGGGALYISNSQTLLSALSVTRSTFVNNLIIGPDGNGGAVNVDNADAQLIIFSDSIFVNNSATNGTGGAIYAKRGFSVTDTIFGYNKAPLCAALNIDQSNFDRSMSLTTSTFLYNSASGSTVRGNIGGVGCIRNADVSILGSTFSHNTAAGSGGVFALEDSIIYVNSSTFKNNSATVDGGVFYTGVFPSNYTVTQCNFTNNTAGDDGGVIYVGRNGSFSNIAQNSITHNQANDRGGIAAVFGSSINVSETNMINNAANFGDDISICSSYYSNIVPTLNERFDPKYSQCTLYDGTIQGHSVPIPHDNSDFDVTRFFQTFVGEIADPATTMPTPNATTVELPANTSNSTILKDIQNRLYGTSVLIYLLFAFAIIAIITVIILIAVKCILSRRKASQEPLNAPNTMCTSNQYSESIELYEEAEWNPPRQTAAMPQKSTAQFGNRQRYVKNH